MRVIFDESIFLFLQENRIKISQKLKMTTEYLKSNPRMYEMITDEDNVRHFVINGIDFGYLIDDDTIIISDCVFVKSNVKLKVR